MIHNYKLLNAKQIQKTLLAPLYQKLFDSLIYTFKARVVAEVKKKEKSNKLMNSYSLWFYKSKQPRTVEIEPQLHFLLNVTVTMYNYNILLFQQPFHSSYNFLI